jgi:hybrid cluster-associated redox disulfide protein
MKDETVAHSLPTIDMTVAEVLESWPETVSVFQDFKTACVGCVMAPFDTMSEVARIYELELLEIMEALHRAVKMADQDGGPATD